MKNISFLLVALLISSCRFSDVEAESDYSYSGKFNRYRTFSFLSNNSFNGNDGEKEAIERNVSKVLHSWGYRQKNKKPDILICYDLFFDELTLKGYSQPQFHDWVLKKYGEKILVPNEELDSLRESDVRGRDEKYLSDKVNMTEGTLLINFFDRKRGKSVWQGYASGIQENDVPENERKIKPLLSEF